MAYIRKFVVSVLAAVPAAGFSYDSAFTLDFETAADPAPGWSDTTYGNTVFVAGEDVSVDSPLHSPAPESAPGYNGTKWLRIGPDVQPQGVIVAAYDGSAGGSTDTAADFVTTVEMFINPSVSTRYHISLFGRWVSGNAPLQVFHASAVPVYSLAGGYGYRGGGTTTSYGAFGGVNETGARWVRAKMTVIGDQATLEVDRDLDGTYDISEGPLTITDTAPGKIGILGVLNDGDSGAVTANQYLYVDNLTYTPLASVSDWSVY